MYTLKNQTTKEKLRDMGFVEKPIIIHPSRVEKDDEYVLGQIDDKGNRKSLLVLRTPKFGRFNADIVVNYRGEIYAVESGFMSGGIETFYALDDKSENLYFRADGRYEFINKILSEIALKDDPKLN